MSETLRVQASEVSLRIGNCVIRRRRAGLQISETLHLPASGLQCLHIRETLRLKRICHQPRRLKRELMACWRPTGLSLDLLFCRGLSAIQIYSILYCFFVVLKKH